MTDLTESNGATRTWTMKAAETTLLKNCFAIMDTGTAGQCKRPPATALVTDIPVGVLQDETHAAGYGGNYQYDGFATAVISESVSIGDKLVIATVTGRVRPLAPATDTSGIRIVGFACEANSTAGNEIVIMLTPSKQFHT